MRLPFYFQGLTLTLPELNHFLVGESLSNGANLYVSLWEDISPLSAWFYMFLYFIFGKSIWIYHVLGFILVFFQSVLFNSITYRNRLYHENTYVPALIYGLLMSLSSEMYSLSPILMSSTFILLAMNNIFRQVEFRIKADEPILNIGVYLGVAALFYLPSAIFGFIALIILAFFSSTIGRRYLLVFYGFALPIFLLITYLYFNDGINTVWNIFSTKVIDSNELENINYQSVLYILAIPLVFFIISFFRVFKRNRFSNYQMRLIQLVIFWLLLSLTLLFWTEKLITSFILFIPSFAIIITHYFLLSKKTFRSELLFMFFFGGIIFLNTSMVFNWFDIEKFIDQKHNLVLSTPYDKYVKDKKIVVLGDNIHIYQNASLATPFLDWQLSSETVKQPDYYRKANAIHNGFINDPPEIIVDLENLMPNLQYRIKFLNNNYTKVAENIYSKKNDQ